MDRIKSILLIGFLILIFAGIWGCRKGNASESSLSPNDSCWNLFARDASYRKGKWVEITDSIRLRYENPDTLWFISDSLMAWSFPCCYSSYLYTHMHFGKCNLFICQSWDSMEQIRGTVYYRSEYLDYNKNIVSIVYNAGLGFDTFRYRKIQ